MKQQCNLWNVWLTWLGIPALVIAAVYLKGWLTAVFVLVVAVAAELVYLRLFPHMSQLLGYGSVADELPEETPSATGSARVTLYTASLCPFCPIVRERLRRLQETMDFEVDEIDVTLKTDLIREKGIRGVPVIEVDGRMIHGNATTAQLVDLIAPNGRPA